MDGFQFEYRCAELLRNRGFHKVSVTKSVGDQGIDVIAYKNGEKYGIQCKYYTHTVGNKAVQEAYSGAGFYDCNHAVVMTNSTFSRAARELAEKLDVELMEGCLSNDISSALYKIMKFINASVLLLLTFVVCGNLAFQYPVLSVLSRVYLGVAFLAAVTGLTGWHRILPCRISFILYLLLSCCMITPEIVYGTLNPLLFFSLLPVAFMFLHLIFLRRDMDASDEKRPLHRKQKRKIARLGKLYGDSLSASLNISVTYRHGALTEEGYLFTYDSPCTDEHALRKAVTNFGKTFHNYYELQITEDGFTVLQHTRNQNRREEPPA